MMPVRCIARKTLAKRRRMSSGSSLASLVVQPSSPPDRCGERVRMKWMSWSSVRWKGAAGDGVGSSCRYSS
eukprot:3057473-Pyramimonas_sp.AAC.1